jgi:hypothetical protein
MNTSPTAEGVEAVEAVMHFTFLNPQIVLDAAYGVGHHESYYAEKAQALRRNPAVFFLHLDPGNRRNLVNAAVAYHRRRFDYDEESS